MINLKNLLNQLEEKYSVLFNSLSQPPNDLINFLDKILINKRDV